MPLEQPPSKPPPPQRTLLHAAMAAEIELGLESARDPENAALPPLAIRTTTIYSRWYTQKCPECGYKFREGDRVVACPCGCGAYFHDDIHRHLTCWNDWNGPKGRDYCTISGKRIDRPAEPHDR